MSVSKIVPARNADGRLELFATDKQSGALWHIGQTTANGGWGGWAALGNAVGLGPLVAGTNADGRLEVFSVDTAAGLAWHIWQTAPNGNWGNWVSLERPSSGVPLKQCAIALNTNGQLELFATDQNGSPWHIWQIAPNGSWGGWATLGIALPGGLGPLAVGTNADGRLEVFSIDTSGSAWHIWQTAPNGNWGNWVSLGKPPSGVPLNQCAVGLNTNGLLELFATDKQDGSPWHIWQVNPGGNWGGWAALGPELKDPRMDLLVVGTNADGRLEIFSIGNPLAYAWNIWQTQPGGNWYHWVSMSGRSWLNSIAVANDADGRLDVFTADIYGNLEHIWQTAPNGNWGSWIDMGDPNPPSPSPPLPAKIEYLNAEPNNGYVNLGTSATLSWQVTNTQADTKAKLQGRIGLGGSGAVVFNKTSVQLQGSQMVTPGEDTQYTLTVTDSRGQVSQEKWVTVYAPPTPPPGSVFYFKMTDPQSQITPCFTIAIYAKDQESAKALAEQQNGGYKAESIDASQFMTACG